MTKIIAVVCYQSNGGIGYQNRLLFGRDELPGDLPRFKQLTVGTNLIMGRKTWESLEGFRPLPDRRNIIITRRPSQLVDSSLASNVMSNFLEALARCRQIWKDETISIGGGGEIYELGFPYCDEIYTTEVICNRPADTFITKPTALNMFIEAERSEKMIGKTGLEYYFVRYERKNNTVSNYE